MIKLTLGLRGVLLLDDVSYCCLACKCSQMSLNYRKVSSALGLCDLMAAIFRENQSLVDFAHAYINITE